MTADTDMTDDELREIELTAYALDELDAEGRAAMEARLDDEPALRERVADIRAEAITVGAAFANEPVPAAGEPPAARSPWVRRGLALAACLGLAGGTAWLVGPAVRAPSEPTVSGTTATHSGIRGISQSPATIDNFSIPTARKAGESVVEKLNRSISESGANARVAPDPEPLGLPDPVAVLSLIHI